MNDVSSLIRRRYAQLIVHSFLYYVLDETLVSDSQFDEWRRELVDLHASYPTEARGSPYYSICREFETSPSGFFFAKRGYPPELVSVAFHVLYDGRGRPGRFDEFVASYGFSVE